MPVKNTITLSFDKFATEIVTGFKSFDQAQAKLSEVVETSMQQFVDHVATTMGRDQKACEAMKKAIYDSQVVIDTVAQGIMEKKTFTEYAQSAMRALHFNVEFAPSLKNDETKKLPWSKKGASSTSVKAGKVEVTTIAEMHKTLSKALAQARVLNQTIFAGELVDFIVETYPDFKETVL
jgi:hypothetical protein